ncbi:MAG: peptidoglycan DD-metalloendopeptidase family protein [Prevotellaceae bacterium]|jgi:murein DD-endopeptidase MepM/ murein hydrolase activator NlpD|nr:peptidoglycan DD-metalloendopeptidase family protein [Prevotellaceae bacterium]
MKRKRTLLLPLFFALPLCVDGQLKNMFAKEKHSAVHTETVASYPVPKLRQKLEIKAQVTEPADLQDWDERLDLDADSGGDDAIPSDVLYAIWNNLQVNPYKMPIDSIIGNGDCISVSLKGFTYPLVKNYRVSSEFGPRRYRHHNGIDLKLYKGDSILSAMDGTVRIAKRVSGYGNLVAIRHYNGLETFYGHLSKLLVKPDQTVKSGDLIGYGGSTGRSTGPHLHFEIRYMGHCINPRDIVDFDSLCAVNEEIILTRKNFDHNNRKFLSGNKSALKTWSVREGDTLTAIARRTKTSVKYLCSVNGITSKTTIIKGMKLFY